MLMIFFQFFIDIYDTSPEIAITLSRGVESEHNMVRLRYCLLYEFKLMTFLNNLLQSLMFPIALSLNENESI